MRGGALVAGLTAVDPSTTSVATAVVVSAGDDVGG